MAHMPVEDPNPISALIGGENASSEFGHGLTFQSTQLARSCGRRRSRGLKYKNLHRKRRRVVILSCDGFDRGGIGRWTGYLCDAWAHLKLMPPMTMIDTRAPSGNRLLSSIVFAKVLLQLVWLSATGQLAVIHANVADYGSTVRKWLVSELARWIKTPVVVHLHAGNFVEFYASLPRWMRSAVHRMFGSAAQIIVPGRVWKEALVSNLGLESNRIEVLYNGVPRSGGPCATAKPDAACHIVMLARLSASKGVGDLLSALASDGVRPLGWRATLAGSGAEPYRQQASRLGIADRVEFPGWLDAESASFLLGNADIAVLPSHFECMPMMIIEAMAHAVAVISTPVGATPDIVQDGISGLLIPVRDVDALAGALKRLISNPQLRRALAEAGHKTFEQELVIDRGARSLEAMYRRILATQNHEWAHT